MKAALISAFVFPGAGHLYLKKYVPGAVLAGASLAALGYLIAVAVERALQLAAKIQNGEVPLDIAAITAWVTTQSAGAESPLLNVATLVIVICWIIGIIDSCRIGGRGNDSEGA